MAQPDLQSPGEANMNWKTFTELARPRLDTLKELIDAGGGGMRASRCYVTVNTRLRLLEKLHAEDRLTNQQVQDEYDCIKPYLDDIDQIIDPLDVPEGFTLLTIESIRKTESGNYEIISDKGQTEIKTESFTNIGIDPRRLRSGDHLLVSVTTNGVIVDVRLTNIF